jgi:hypothetical protein
MGRILPQARGNVVRSPTIVGLFVNLFRFFEVLLFHLNIAKTGQGEKLGFAVTERVRDGHCLFEFFVRGGQVVHRYVWFGSLI